MYLQLVVGGRVLRSLTMLLSSGVHTNYEIVPMIVDPDQSNGDFGSLC